MARKNIQGYKVKVQSEKISASQSFNITACYDDLQTSVWNSLWLGVIQVLRNAFF